MVTDELASKTTLKTLLAKKHLTLNVVSNVPDDANCYTTVTTLYWYDGYSQVLMPLPCSAHDDTGHTLRDLSKKTRHFAINLSFLGGFKFIHGGTAVSLSLNE